MSSIFSKIKSVFQPEQTFIGLIGDFGASKARYKDNTHTLNFTFIAFAREGEDVIHEEVYLSKPIPSFDFNSDGLDALTIVKVKGTLTKFEGRNKIEFSSVLEIGGSHEGLNKIREQCLVPVYYHSTAFGKLTFNRRMEEFETHVQWLSSEIRLALNCTLDNAAETERHAVQLLKNAEEWHMKFNAKIIEDLLPLKNQFWLNEEDDEPPMAAEDFISRITIESINVRPDGDVDGWFHDGDTFLGHSICVNAHIDGEVAEAGIHG